MWKKLIYFILFVPVWISAAELECATLITPVAGSNNAPTSTIIRWTDQPEAIGYEVTVGTSQFENDIVQQTIYTENFTEQLTLPPNTTIYVIIIPFSNTQFAVGCEFLMFSTSDCSYFVNPVSEVVLAQIETEQNTLLIDFEKLERELVGEQENLVITYLDQVGNLIDLRTLEPNTENNRFAILAKVTDALSCSKNVEFMLVFERTFDVPEIYYPKFFSPNGDGINDFWNLESLEKFNIFSIQIHDRYGSLISQFSIDDQGWDGTLNGSPAPAADYWFVLLNEEKPIKGHFSLKR